MKSQNPSTSLGEGRGNCPLPSRTHPQKLNLVVYTDELTHLEILLQSITRFTHSKKWIRIPSSILSRPSLLPNPFVCT